MFMENVRNASCIAMKTVTALAAVSMLLMPGGCSKSTNGPAVDNREIVLRSPAGGETFHVGDTLKVTWKVQGQGLTDVTAVDIELSPDNGKTWGLYLDAGSLSPSTGNFSWKIPATFNKGGTIFTLSNDSLCLVRVEQYSPSDTNLISTTRRTFTILP
jgi:hypothetical protein